MKTPKTYEQLSLFGASDTQQHYQSEMWGQLTFYPTNSNKWKDNCRHCLLWVNKQDQTPNDECLNAPCDPTDRADGQHGYFSIHQFPK